MLGSYGVDLPMENFLSAATSCPLKICDFIGRRRISAAQLAEKLASEWQKIDNSGKLRDSTKIVDNLCSNRSNLTNLFVLDFRPASDFQNLHIQRSINISLPPILYKRLVRGTLNLSAIISPSDEQRHAFSSQYKTASIILIEEPNKIDFRSIDNLTVKIWSNFNDSDQSKFQSENSQQKNEQLVSFLLFEKFREEECDVNFFSGSLQEFYLHYPHLCYVKSTNENSALTSLTAPSDHSAFYPLVVKKSESIDTSLHRPDSISLFQRRRHSDDLFRRPTLHLPDMQNLKLADLFKAKHVVDDDPPQSSSRSTVSSSSLGIGSAATLDDAHMTSSSSAFTSLSSSTDDADTAPLIYTDQQGEYLPNENAMLCSTSDVSNRHLEHPSFPVDYRFPVEIIAGLFLGNSTNAADREMLLKYNIKYILNVTPDLPNVFEKDPDFHYLQLPILDQWSQDLMVYFPAAISFIDSARKNNCGVLVHCLAGISRSVTVTVAYLMHTLCLSMEDAFDLVKDHKPNIAPNLHFMGQLMDFQRHLYGGDLPPMQNRPSNCAEPNVGGAPLTSSSGTLSLSEPPRRRRNERRAAECF